MATLVHSGAYPPLNITFAQEFSTLTLLGLADEGLEQTVLSEPDDDRDTM